MLEGMWEPLVSHPVESVKPSLASLQVGSSIFLYTVNRNQGSATSVTAVLKLCSQELFILLKIIKDLKELLLMHGISYQYLWINLKCNNKPITSQYKHFNEK